MQVVALWKKEVVVQKSIESKKSQNPKEKKTRGKGQKKALMAPTQTCFATWSWRTWSIPQCTSGLSWGCFTVVWLAMSNALKKGQKHAWGPKAQTWCWQEKKGKKWCAAVFNLWLRLMVCHIFLTCSPRRGKWLCWRENHRNVSGQDFELKKMVLLRGFFAACDGEDVGTRPNCVVAKQFSHFSNFFSQLFTFEANARIPSIFFFFPESPQKVLGSATSSSSPLHTKFNYPTSGLDINRCPNNQSSS